MTEDAIDDMIHLIRTAGLIRTADGRDLRPMLVEAFEEVRAMRLEIDALKADLGDALMRLDRVANQSW